ncbi:carboxymuconolactone decarboxylase family protein [Variovorax paradoxus]|nr:carboxymuconolactone decarboxylase family protein [Variovorax paradoxus]
MSNERTENFEKGLTLRRQLSGDKVVDEAFRDPEDFAYPMEVMVTEVAWGAAWGRPGLDRRSRSILNLGILAALNRPEQLAGHIGIALKNGVTKTEIQEVLLQVAAYAGMPAGMVSFKIAKEVFAKLEA